MDTIRSVRSHGEKLISGQRCTQYPAGRVCEAPECWTLLSRYNPETTCSRHGGWAPAVAPPARPAAAETTPGIDWITWVMTGGSTDAG